AEAMGLKPIPDASRFGVMGVWWAEPRYGPEGQALFNANREKYVKLGRLSGLSPLPEPSAVSWRTAACKQPLGKLRRQATATVERCV
ncbi:MAG: hypothetical protein ACC628_24690, partial [Pirellulaceae bacterium]